MNTNTDPVRALADHVTDHLCAQEYDIGGRDELRAHVAAALASAPPSAPVGVERARRQAVLDLSEAARCLGVAQAKDDKGAMDYWGDKVAQCEAALAQQPAAPSGEAVAILHPQPRKLGSYGGYYDPPRTHRAFTYAHQPDNLLASRLGDAFRKAAAGSAGDGIDRGLVLLLALQEAGFGVFQVEPSSAAPQQPAAVDEAMEQRALNAQPFAESRNSGVRVWQLFLDERDAGAIMRAALTAALAAQQQGGAE